MGRNVIRCSLGILQIEEVIPLVASGKPCAYNGLLARNYAGCTTIGDNL